MTAYNRHECLKIYLSLLHIISIFPKVVPFSEASNNKNVYGDHFLAIHLQKSINVK